MKGYNDKKNEQLQKLLGKTQKKSIYHYTSIDGLKSILKNKSIWLSDISFLNDESEMKYTLDLINDYLDSVKKYDGEYKDIIKKVISNLKNPENNPVRYSYYVVSFSLNSDSLPIWIYYTKDINSSGYNIEFDKNKITQIIKNYSSNGCLSGQVIYNKTKQLNIIRQILNKYFDLYLVAPEAEEWNSGKKMSLLSAVNDLQIFSLFFKSSYFKNEEEYRIVVPVMQFGDERLINLDFRTSTGMLIPFINIPFKEKIECVKGIKISPTQKSPLIEKGLKEFIIAQQYKDIDITKSKIPLRY